MQIIRSEPNPSGSYPPIQSGSLNAVPQGYYLVSDAVNTSVFYEYNGFVTLTVEDGAVTDMVPNTEAWEAWKADTPTPTQPEPTQMDRIEAQVLYTALLTDTLMED